MPMTAAQANQLIINLLASLGANVSNRLRFWNYDLGLCWNGGLAEAGGFDSKYFLHFEDFDLSLRLDALAGSAYLSKMRSGNLVVRFLRQGFGILVFIRSGSRFFPDTDGDGFKAMRPAYSYGECQQSWGIVPIDLPRV